MNMLSRAGLGIMLIVEREEEGTRCVHINAILVPSLLMAGQWWLF